jgi:hypothetical protein
MTDTEIKTVTFEDIERRLINQARDPYYNWLRHVVTLSLAALTSLVALQGHYMPTDPTAVHLLAIGWLALAVVIMCGLYVLSAEHRTPLKAAKEIRKMRKDFGDYYAVEQLNKNRPTYPGGQHNLAVRIMVASFLIALLSICAFAIINLPWGS